MGAEGEAPERKTARALREARLLPWTGSESKPCYLITDDCGGPLSRLTEALRDALRISESRAQRSVP